MHYGEFTRAAQRAEERGWKEGARRMRTEGRVINALVEALLAKGATVSVFDGEEWALKRSSDRTAIMDTLFATDQDEIVARDAAGNKLGWFLLIYGNDGWDVISDYSANDFCEAIMTESVNPVADKAEAGLN